jgi:hypothetical protein
MSRRRLRRLSVAMVLLAGLTAAIGGSSIASAQQGATLEVKENRARVKVGGPGFTVELTKHAIKTHIDEEQFGIPEAGFPIVESQSDLGAAPNLRPFECENGTYQLEEGIFETTVRASSNEPRPLPYTPAFAVAFPQILTFVGTLDGVVTNEDGEELRVLITDIAHEVLTPDAFASTAPIHAFFVDSEGRVRDRASLVGQVNIDRTTGEADHQIVDRGTCHQTADLNLGPGTDQSTVFGPFFVLPFNTTVVMP